MSRFIDRTGERYGQVIAIEYMGKRNNKTYWKCKCDCGKVFVTSGQCLSNGHTKSCGCFKSKWISESHSIHGETEGRLHKIWSNMKSRCYNPKRPDYSYYGGKGIKVCKEWLDSYIVFREWALNNGYKEDLTIDRIDSDKDYSPDNCRWANRLEQCLNQKRTRRFTYKGETKTASEWSVIYGVPSRALRGRMDKGWNMEDALLTPVHHRKAVKYG